jgi:type II secretion system protein J
MKKGLGKKGFTLFEVLMAISIMAVLFSLLYMIFHQSLKVMAAAEDQAEIIQQGRLILEKMTAELKGAYLTPGVISKSFQYGLVGSSRAEKEDFTDRIDFTALASPFARLQEDGWEILELGYFLEREPGGRGFTLYRRQDSARDRDLLKGGQILAIGDRVRSLKFSYIDRQGKTQKEWNSLDGTNRGRLPVRVEIQLKLEDPLGRVHGFRTQVYLPLAGEVGGT